MATRIDTVEELNKLKPRKATYWHTVCKSCQLGFRRMSADAPGTWLVQAYDAPTSKQTRCSLGDFSDIAPGERWSTTPRSAQSNCRS